MAQWYYTIGNDRFGPFEEAAFRQMARERRVPADSFVWNETMSAWEPVSSIPGLLAGTPAGGAAQAAIPLTYATPTRGMPALMQAGIHSIPGLAEDVGPFQKIAGSFQGPRGNWTAPVYASPLAFYLLKISRQQQYQFGGLLGILIASAVNKADDIRTCKIRELSPAAATAIDPRGKRGDYDVIVLPMAAIHRTQYGRWSSILEVFAGYDRFGLVTNIFGKGKVRRFLAENGWYLNQDLSPTAAQIHGEGLNRAFGEKPKRRMSAVIKVALILLGVIIGMAVLAAVFSK